MLARVSSPMDGGQGGSFRARALAR
jgi:hypothetical protein